MRYYDPKGRIRFVYDPDDPLDKGELGGIPGFDPEDDSNLPAGYDRDPWNEIAEEYHSRDEEGKWTDKNDVGEEKSLDDDYVGINHLASEARIRISEYILEAIECGDREGGIVEWINDFLESLEKKMRNKYDVYEEYVKDSINSLRDIYTIEGSLRLRGISLDKIEDMALRQTNDFVENNDPVGFEKYWDSLKDRFPISTEGEALLFALKKHFQVELERRRQDEELEQLVRDDSIKTDPNISTIEIDDEIEEIKNSLAAVTEEFSNPDDINEEFNIILNYAREFLSFYENNGTISIETKRKYLRSLIEFWRDVSGSGENPDWYEDE